MHLLPDRKESFDSPEYETVQLKVDNYKLCRKSLFAKFLTGTKDINFSRSIGKLFFESSKKSVMSLFYTDKVTNQNPLFYE